MEDILNLFLIYSGWDEKYDINFELEYPVHIYNLSRKTAKIFNNMSKGGVSMHYRNSSFFSEIRSIEGNYYISCTSHGYTSDTRYDLYLANIEFMYNYENAPNKGHYWIDDLETGEILSYIPSNPTRDGYTFGGWYADSECTIEYDFNVPHIKKDLLEGSYTWQEEVYTGINTYTDYYLYYPEDYVTYIYAKWIEN